MSTVTIIGAAIGHGAGNNGTCDGPVAFKQSAQFARLSGFTWADTLQPIEKKDNFTTVVAFLNSLYEKMKPICESGKPFCVIGGDHSIAIGTWSAAAIAKREQGEIGLLWIDAHLDAHTHETSLSGNIHGMPVAALLGAGVDELTQVGDRTPKLAPDYLAKVGIRSFEQAEHKLNKELGLTTYYMDEVENLGVGSVIGASLSVVGRAPAGFGISIDLDGLDPSDAPGVGTAVERGIALAPLCDALRGVGRHPRFIGLEIVEFNPHLDKEARTLETIATLLEAVFEQGD